MCNRRSNLRKTPKFERFSKVWRPVSPKKIYRFFPNSHSRQRSLPSYDEKSSRKIVRRLKSQGPPKICQNSNRYNSKPEVEINFVPTLNFIVLSCLKSTQWNVRKRVPQVGDFKPPKNSNPHMWGERNSWGPKNYLARKAISSSCDHEILKKI